MLLEMPWRPVGMFSVEEVVSSTQKSSAWPWRVEKGV